MTRNHLRQLLRSVRISLLRLQQQLDLSVLRTKQRCCLKRAPEKTSRTWRWARGSLSRTGREWQCWCSQKLSRRSRSYNLTKRWWSLRKVPLMRALTVTWSLGVVAAKFGELHPGEISRVFPTAPVSLVEVTSFGLEISGEPDQRHKIW